MSSTTTTTPAGPSAADPLDLGRVQAFAQQVGGVVTAGATTAMMAVGDRLGLYAGLARSGPSTPGELASRTGTTERYVAEWLAQQTAAGFVTHDPADGTFTLPPEHAAVLATDDPPASMISAVWLATGLHRRVDQLVEAFRTGRGIPWGEQDGATFEQTERFFRIGYRTHLVQTWVPALDGVHDKLVAGATVADVGTGRGAPLVLLAQAYPASRFVGYDLHEPSVEVARQRAEEAGVADRARFEVGFDQGYPQSGYDVITFFDTFHDLGDPVASARYARRALAPDGTLVLVEPRAADDLATTVATVPTAALGFAASTFLCVPNSLSQPGSTALGAQAGAARTVEVLREAGFSSVRVAVESDFNTVLEARP